MSTSMSRKDVVITLGLFLAAIITRSYGLGANGLFGDETTSVARAVDRAKGLVNPAYYNLVLLSFKLFGHSEWSARLPAMVLGVLSIPLFFLTWRSIIGRREALMGSLLVLFSSWHLRYSQFSRFYSGVFLFGSLAYVLYYWALRDDMVTYVLLALASTVVAALFHVTAVFVAGGCGLFSLIVLLSGRRYRSEFSRRVAGIHLGMCALAAVLLVPFLWGLATHRHGTTGTTWGDTSLGMILQLTRKTQLPIALPAFFGLVFMVQRHRWQGIFFAATCGSPLAALIVGSNTVNCNAAYVFYTLPLLIALAAYFCSVTRDALSSFTVGRHAILLSLLVFLMPEMISQYTGKRSLDVRDVVSFVKENGSPDDAIISCVWEFHYYIRDWNKPEPYPGNPMVQKRGWRDILEPYKEREGRTWIVLPAYRQPLVKELELWLRQNARLVWRKFEKRLDYPVNGYQVFLVSAHGGPELKPGSH